MLIFYVSVFFLLFIPDAQLHMYDVNYGPYVAECSCFNITYPDHKNLSYSTSHIEKLKDKYFVNINITVFIPVHIDEVKIFVYKVNNTKEVLWQYRLKNPCQHYALSSLMRDHLHVDYQCFIKKGTYKSTVNLTDALSVFLGTSFFYGDYMFKVNTVTNRGSLISVVAITTFKRKL